MTTALSKREADKLQRRVERHAAMRRRMNANKKRAQYRGVGALVAAGLTEVVANQAGERIAAGEDTLLPEVFGMDIAQVGKPLAVAAVAAGAFGVTGNDYADESLFAGGIALYTMLRMFDVIAEDTTEGDDSP